METLTWRKVVQKQIYDLLSHRYGLLIIIIGIFVIVVSALHFGEVRELSGEIIESVAEWSTEKYAAVFNSFSDNLAGKSFRERLSLPVPIDVVYTWVNGTDPQLIMNLKRLKLDMQDQLNTSRKIKCVFSNCLPSNIVVIDPNLPENMTLTQLGLMYSVFTHAKVMFKVTSPIDYGNYTAVVFTEEEHVLEALNKTLKVGGHNTTIVRCYITSDATIQNGIKLTDQIIMSGFPHTLTTEELKMKLPEKHQKVIEKIEVYSDKGVALLHVPVKEDFDKVLAEANFTIDGKEPTLNAANLVWDLRDFSRDEDISASRFEDNEELRYSLRSLERFAPWIRHVYIVTNGQLPYWLNLENPRITIVTHEEIFANSSHLPSFGSPAIESNLHRIPGLSDKFIYMNDDVMFGKEVWPDDFYTHSTGQKVYLTWPVPNCNEGCPSSWIKDGYCDKACNVSECEWDAGDCTGVLDNARLGGWSGGAGSFDSHGYCHTGCANNWIADRYCDTACNVIDCAYDAGDCGTDKYNELHGFMLLPNTTTYLLPKGLFHSYFNLSTILSNKNDSIKDAFYDDNNIIRTIAVAKKFNVLTVILHKDVNKTQINFTIVYGHENYTTQLNFTLAVDTVPLKIGSAAAASLNKTSVHDDKNISIASNDSKANEANIAEEEIVFHEIPVDLEKPVLLIPSAASDMSTLTQNMPTNLSDVPLPPHLKQLYVNLQSELKEEELTETGYLKRLTAIQLSYQHYLHFNQSQAESKGEQHQKNQSKDVPQTNNDAHLPPKENKPVVDQQSQNEFDTEGRRLNIQNEADPAKAAGRKLLNINEVQMNIGESVTTVTMEEKAAKNDFVSSVDIQPEMGKIFPWEQGSLATLQEEKERREAQNNYQVTSGVQGRRLLDTFGDSLRHVNTLYNKAFGHTPRKVPGHMPHMIDKNIMFELQARFPKEWEVTSSHKVRSSTDMQYAFAYFYYLMGVKENITATEVFDEMDTDKSKVLSDRELRTLATRLYALPLDLPTLTKLENVFVNCSIHLTAQLQQQPDATASEQYYEQYMPQVTRNLFIHCPEVEALVRSNFPPRNKYKHITVDDAEIAFKMIKSNISTVVGQLDDIRKHPKKFICLNDNIEHKLEQAKTVKAILQDFYESVFPITSQFELPREYRNRFTHISELREWRKYRDWLKFWTHIALVLLVVFTVASYFADKIEAAQRRFIRRRPAADQSSGNEEIGAEGGTVETV